MKRDKYTALTIAINRNHTYVQLSNIIPCSSNHTEVQRVTIRPGITIFTSKDYTCISGFKFSSEDNSNVTC